MKKSTKIVLVVVVLALIAGVVAYVLVDKKKCCGEEVVNQDSIPAEVVDSLVNEVPVDTLVVE